jgi:peptidoglycan/LPS O-acetylase OafA/YrhL
LRIYPIYIVVLLLTMLFQILHSSSRFIETISQLPFLGQVYLLLCNIFILGQDVVMFLSFNSNNLNFTSNFRDSDILIYHGLLIPQAWTLALEFYFYLLAPFIYNRVKILLALLLLSVCIRAYTFSEGLAFQDPWTYRFFPSELSLFILGMLIYRRYLNLIEKNRFTKLRSVLCVSAILGVITCYTLIKLPVTIKHAAFVILICLALPYLFNFQNRFKFDKRVGELSFPIYVCHILIIDALTTYLPGLRNEHLYLFSMTVVTFTLLFSIGLNRLVDPFIIPMRNRIRNDYQRE